MKSTLLIFLLSFQCCLSFAKNGILIVVLPQNNIEVSASWERGEKILPGAYIPIKEAKIVTQSYTG